MAGKYRIPTEAERLEQYFMDLARVIPNPGRDWAKSAVPCKYLKLLKERKERLQNAKEETR
jgi:hypothetical protein